MGKQSESEKLVTKLCSELEIKTSTLLESNQKLSKIKNELIELEQNFKTEKSENEKTTKQLNDNLKMAEAACNVRIKQVQELQCEKLARSKEIENHKSIISNLQDSFNKKIETASELQKRSE